MYTSNDIHLYSIFDPPFCIFVILFIVCCHGLCHHCHILQIKCHLQFQTHLAASWTSHLSFSGTCHPMELLQIEIKLVNFGNISFRVHPLWNGHINALLNLARSRHNLTFPFDFGTNTKLFHHSTPISIITSLGMVFMVHRPHVLAMPDMVCHLL